MVKVGTYVVDCPASASSPYERNPALPRQLEIDLFPWVLIPANDDTRAISIDQ